MQKMTDYLGLRDVAVGASQQKINRLENLMTLNKNVHRYWDTGKIILEPVGDPLAVFESPNASPTPILRHYDVIFSYLPSHRRPSEASGWDHNTLVQAVPIPSLQYSEDEDPILNGIYIVRLGEGGQIRQQRGPPQEVVTGMRIRLMTLDPVKYPLPHPDLLRLHAALSRVVRCAAAAEPEQFGDGGDDEEADVELDWEMAPYDCLSPQPSP